jgi:hypothetical protein
LADLVVRALGASGAGRIHTATRVFQALRRAVNEEGEELLAPLAAAEHWLPNGGRVAVIAVHSGGDGEVKRFLAAGARDRRFALVTRKPIEADHEERRANPRARSARLRVAERMRPARDEARLNGNGGNGDHVAPADSGTQADSRTQGGSGTHADSDVQTNRPQEDSGSASGAVEVS